MILGYRDFYVTGCVNRVETQHPLGKSFNEVEVHRIGYLKPEEVRYAAHLMTFGAPPPGF
jgi:hypothetical protein